MSANFRQTMKQSLGLRRPHTASVEHIIDKIGEIYDAFDAVKRDALADKNLSAQGQRAKISEHFKNETMTALATATRPVRKAMRHVVDQRAGLRQMSEPAACDALENARRAEIRTFLRGLPSDQRFPIAQSDPRFYEAALDAPAALSGLPPQMLEQIRTERTEARVQEAHGPALKDLDYIESDYEVANQVAIYYLNTIQADAEISAHTLQQIWQPLVASADA